MQVSISARHGDLSQETQAVIEQKASKLTRFFDRITAIVVTADLGHTGSPAVEIRVTAEAADDFVATDTANNVVAAVEGTVQKLEQQLRKHKEKITSHRNASAKHVEPPIQD